MAITNPLKRKSLLLDKKELQQHVAEANERLGLIKDSTATAQKARELMLAQGIRPEDHILSKEIIRRRYEAEEK